jgi:hypothetical protein
MIAGRERKSLGRQSGQAAVESVIVLPLFVFLILGTLQLFLMHQARLVTKYAAYKAVRAGSLHNARKAPMERAALAVLLPIISQASGSNENIKTVNSASDFQAKWMWPGVIANRMIDTGIPYVEVVTCGPSKKELSGTEVDFDDPRYAASGDWRASQRTKLRIQLTFNYRMPIPFANWVIHASAFNREIPLIMRMGQKPTNRNGRDFGPSTSLYKAAAASGKYVLPIRAAYTMRMQSNVFVKELPGSNACITTNKF